MTMSLFDCPAVCMFHLPMLEWPNQYSQNLIRISYYLSQSQRPVSPSARQPVMLFLYMFITLLFLATTQ